MSYAPGSGALPAGAHECCAGDLEIYSAAKGVLGALASPWKKAFFQLLVLSDGSVLLSQWSSAREQQEPWTRPSSLPPVPTYHLHQVEDIVQGAAPAQRGAWFELWFANGAVVRLRTCAADKGEHWSTWVAQLLVNCPRVRARLVSTLDSDPSQSTVHGNSPAQLRGEELVSLRAEALRSPEIAAIVGAHPDFAAKGDAAGAGGSGGGGGAPTNPTSTAAHLAQLKDSMLSETRLASTMVEDRLALVETGLRSATLDTSKHLTSLTGSLEVCAANIATLMGEVAGLNAREASASATALTRLDALGASVLESGLRTRGDIGGVRSSLEHVEKLVLGLAPRVVPAVGSGGASALSRTSSSRGAMSPTPQSAATGAAGGSEGGGGPGASAPPGHPAAGLAPEASVTAVLTALMNHTRAVDEGLVGLFERQKATDDAVHGLRDTLVDISRSMVELSRRQEALWVKMGAMGGSGGGGGGGGGGDFAHRRGAGSSSSSSSSSSEESEEAAAAYAHAHSHTQAYAPSSGGHDEAQAPYRASRAPSQHPSRSAAAPHAPGGDASGSGVGAAADGTAVLLSQQAAVLRELSRVTELDLTTSTTVVGAVTRIPVKVRSRPEVSALLSRLRILDTALENARGK